MKKLVVTMDEDDVMSYHKEGFNQLELLGICDIIKKDAMADIEEVDEGEMQ